MRKLQARLLIDSSLTLGEGLQLFPDEKLHCVDIPNGQTFVLSEESLVLEKSFSHETSKVLPWEQGQLVLGRNYIHQFDQLGGEIGTVAVCKPDSNLRCSDGCVLPDGSLLIGLVDRDLIPGQGSLLRITNNLLVEVIVDAATIPNGVAVMPDGKSVVWVDSPEQKLMLFPIAENGSLGKPKELFEIPNNLGTPDGLTVDQRGGIWVALWGGGKVIRISADQEIDFEISVECQNVTSCAFDSAGKLLITTASVALSEADAGKAGAGGIWVCDLNEFGFSGIKSFVSKIRHI